METSAYAGPDRRRHTRENPYLAAQVRKKRSPGSNYVPAIVEDVSRSGLRLRADAPLHEGDWITLFMEHDAELVSAKVVWVEKSGHEAWRVGCRRQVLIPKPDGTKTRTRHAKKGSRAVAVGVGLAALVVLLLMIFL